nr:hypothetical protein GCM10025699_38670 [Microbacterium flavescens]
MGILPARLRVKMAAIAGGSRVQRTDLRGNAEQERQPLRINGRGITGAAATAPPDCIRQTGSRR